MDMTDGEEMKSVRLDSLNVEVSVGTWMMVALCTQMRGLGGRVSLGG